MVYGFELPVRDRRPKVLVVDDAPQNIDLIRQVLADRDYDIFSALSGTEALSQLNRINPDIILLDVVMPGMNGYEVADKIKNNGTTRLIPIIMITALDGTEDRLRGLKAGVDDFISKPVNVYELRARIHNLLTLREYVKELEHAEQVIFSLARAVEAKDKYLEGHSERISRLSMELGRRLGLSDVDLTILKRGGILHDLGKIAIQDSILLKPSKLTSEEFSIIKSHTIIGERICAPLKTLKPVLPVIRYHHERADGSGYPEGLTGKEIPIHAHVIGIVDCFDALITHRAYRRALSKEEALVIMKEEAKRGLWDTEIIDIFFSIVK